MPVLSNSVKRAFSSLTLADPVYPICIIGSGPAGFYTAGKILKLVPNAIVHIFDALPTPYGLVRYGVAPDHPEVKSVIHKFEQIAQDPRCEFFGNVKVGNEVQIEQLQKRYSGVVVACGASEDRKLHLDGETSVNGIISARAFVNWYNGHPEYQKLPFSLRDKQKVVIVGQGNVAIDVARILLTPVGMLSTTDITTKALQELSESQVKEVHLVGRRGPVQISITSAEMREMFRLPNLNFHIDEDLFQNHLKLFEEELKKNRPKKRLMAIIENGIKQKKESGTKDWFLHFLKSPEAIHANRHGSLQGVTFRSTLLQTGKEGQVSSVSTDHKEEMEADMLVSSIGYKSSSLPGVPFDSQRGVIPNVLGRVISGPESFTFLPGLYTSGWIKRGPVGVIGSTMQDAYETAAVVAEDIQTKALTSKPIPKDIPSLVSQPIVSFQNWKKLDEEEVFRWKYDWTSKPSKRSIAIPKHKTLSSQNPSPNHIKKPITPYYTDPYLLAEKVRILSKKNIQEALNLVSSSPYSSQSVVVWNTLLYEIAKRGMVRKAFKAFNDMKKRGLTPTSYSYLPLFQACQIQMKLAGSTDHYDVALDLWKKLVETNPTTVTIYHLNSLLKTCAFVKDWDTLLDLYRNYAKPSLARVPKSRNLEQGVQLLPDAITFNIMLHSCSKMKNDQGVMEALSIWRDLLIASGRETTTNLDDKENSQKQCPWKFNIDSGHINGLIATLKGSQDREHVLLALQLAEKVFNPNIMSQISKKLKGLLNESTNKTRNAAFKTSTRPINLESLLTKKVKIQPDAASIHLLLGCFMVLGFNKHGIEFHKYIEHNFKDIRFDSYTESAYIRLLCQERQPSEVARALKDTLELGITLPNESYLDIFRLCVEERNWEIAIQVFSMYSSQMNKEEKFLSLQVIQVFLQCGMECKQFDSLLEQISSIQALQPTFNEKVRSLKIKTAKEVISGIKDAVNIALQCCQEVIRNGEESRNKVAKQMEVNLRQYVESLNGIIVKEKLR